MEAFGTALIAIALVGLVAAVASYYGSGRVYRGLGRGGSLGMDALPDAHARAEARPDAALAEEVRQLIVAANERRARQGEPPLDVEDEVERRLRALRG
ncbi:MAG: hypothetical protein ACM3UV_04330 [Nocardioidaceae bacterium]